MARILADEERIGDAGFQKSLRPKNAAITSAARPSARAGIVAAVRERVIEPELDAAADDVSLGHRDERRVHTKPGAFDAGSRREVGQPLEGAHELGPAVG